MRRGRFRAGLVVMLGISVAACGDDGEDGSAGVIAQGPPETVTPTPAPETTPAPSASADEIVVASPAGSTTIGGEPPTAVAAGTAYAFTPRARGRDGHRLTFDIANKPAWAAFNSRTGRLSGTPGAEHVGTASGIVISVHDGETRSALAAFDLTVLAFAPGSATLTWLPPTTNTDGSRLTNLSGYRVHWGTARGDYPNSVALHNPGLTTYVVENLAPATYYFAVTSLSATGIESTFSASATKTIR